MADVIRQCQREEAEEESIRVSILSQMIALGAEEKPVSAYLIASKCGKNISDVALLLEVGARLGLVSLEASGWRVVRKKK